MALSGLGPALSGAYANVQKLLLERKLQQEDLDRRRQEAAAIRQEQEENWMRRYQFEARMREQAAEAERVAGEPERRRGEARATIEQLERLVRAGLIPPTDISALITQAAPGVAPFLPQRTSPFGDVPGSFEQQIPRMIPGAPAQTFQGGPAPLVVGRPTQTLTLAQVQPDFFGPGTPGAAYGGYPAPLTDGKPDAKKIADLVDKIHGTIPKPAAPEAAHARRGRVTTELGQLADNVQKSIASGLPEDAARAARAFNARLAQANDPRWSLGIPYPSYVMREVVSQATDRKRDIERPPAGGATETLASMKADIIRRKRAGLPIAEWELRFAGIAFEKQPEEQNLAYLKREAQKTQIKVAGLRKRVDSIGVEGEVLEKAQAALAEAEGEYEALRNAVTAAMQERPGLPSLVPPATPGPFSLRGPGVSPPPSAPAPQRAAPPVTPGPRSITTAELRLIAQRKGMTLDAIRKQAVKQGYTILP